MVEWPDRPPMTRLETIGRVAPGLIAVVILAASAYASMLVLPAIFGAATVGLFLGILVANVRSTPTFDAGAKLARSWLLPLGIVLLGARLSLADVLATGLGAISVLVIDVVLVLLVTLTLGRMMGMSSGLATLIGVGTAICGNSAIIATAPVIKANERDVSFAVATITLFGTAAVVIYPIIGHALGMSDALFGHWTGAAVNDTSQVAAASFSYSTAAGETATVVKLTRNTLMVPVILVVGLWAASLRSGGADADEERSLLGSARRAVPPFLVGFLLMALANSAGLIPDSIADTFVQLSQVFIVGALVGVGLTTKFSTLRATGPAPFLMGLAVAIMLAVVSLALFVGLGIA